LIVRATAASPHLPRNSSEHLLTKIWADLLQLEPSQIGIRDNFFEIGGDSLLAIQVIARARHRGLELAVMDLFVHQTIEELALAGEKSRRNNIPHTKTA
jgi:aryl carrier-like protein